MAAQQPSRRPLQRRSGEESISRITRSSFRQYAMQIDLDSVQASMAPVRILTAEAGFPRIPADLFKIGPVLAPTGIQMAGMRIHSSGASAGIGSTELLKPA